MNDEQFDRNLRSIGMECFVTYFCKFADLTIRNLDVAELLRQERDYTMKSCNSRVSHARAIIRAGRAKDALLRISRSQSALVEDRDRDKARNLAEQL